MNKGEKIPEKGELEGTIQITLTWKQVWATVGSTATIIGGIIIIFWYVVTWTIETSITNRELHLERIAIRLREAELQIHDLETENALRRQREELEGELGTRKPGTRPKVERQGIE